MLQEAPPPSPALQRNGTPLRWPVSIFLIGVCVVIGFVLDENNSFSAIPSWEKKSIDFGAGSANNNSIISNGTQNEGDAPYNEPRIKLCNRLIPSERMPSDFWNGIYNGTIKFGVSNWNRNFSNVLVPLKKVYGQTGNQIREFFHAFDMARDNDMAFAIFHEENFPLESPLMTLWPNLKMFNKTNPNWKETVEDLFGVLVLGSEESHELIPKDANFTRMKTGQFFRYKSENHTLEQRKAHRHYLLQKLYNLTAREMAENPHSEGTIAMCSSVYAYFGAKGATGKEITQNYTVIHSRLLPQKFLYRANNKNDVDINASTDLPPDLITSILTPLGMMNSSIIMITDGSNQNASDRLAADPLIGPLFEIVPSEFSSMISDVMLAIVSNVFIGNPASTLSWFIAIARYALGIEHSYLFYRKRELGEGDWEWETYCDEDCLYDYGSFHWARF